MMSFMKHCQCSVLLHKLPFNRYRRKRPKVDASIFDSALSHTRRKKEENSMSTFGRFRLWTSLESSPVSVNLNFLNPFFKMRIKIILFQK